MTNMTGSERTTEPENKGSQEQTKKPYTTPQLTVHGDVEKITGAVGATGSDGQLGSQIL